AAMPLLDSGCPAHCRNGSVGPLITAPATSGLTATTAEDDVAKAARRPGRARIGPIEMIGFDGPIRIARACSIASIASGVGAAAWAPRYSTSLTGPSPW